MCYSIFMIISGWIGDKVNVRYFYAFALFAVGSCYLGTGLIGYFDVPYAEWFYLGLFLLNGAFQSISWPCCIVVMGNWIEKKQRASVLGVWGVNANIGALIGSALGGLIVDTMDLHWGVLMFISAGIIYFMCLVVLVFLRPYPEKMGIKIYEHGEDDKVLEEAKRINAIGTSKNFDFKSPDSK